MERWEYDVLQAHISALNDSKRLFAKGISGKRKEGYEAAILAVKSMLSDEFHRQEKEAERAIELHDMKKLSLDQLRRIKAIIDEKEE